MRPGCRSRHRRAGDGRGARGRRDERGSVTVETVILGPTLAALLVVIVAGGRVATTHDAVESAAADAARAASLARTGPNAQQQARQAARDSLAAQQLHCQAVKVTVTTAGFTAPVGQPASVTVTVSCRLSLADLSLVSGVPGTWTGTATIASPIDTYRQRATTGTT